jgi:hypothetical protein
MLLCSSLLLFDIVLRCNDGFGRWLRAALNEYNPRPTTTIAQEKRARQKLHAAVRRELTDLRFVCPHTPFEWVVVKSVAEATGDGDDLEVATGELVTTRVGGGASNMLVRSNLLPDESGSASGSGGGAEQRLLSSAPAIGGGALTVTPAALRTFSTVKTLYTAYCPVCGRICDQKMLDDKPSFRFGSGAGDAKRTRAAAAPLYRPPNAHINPTSGVFATQPPPIASMTIQTDEEFR